MAFRWRFGVIALGLMLTALGAAPAWGAPVQRFTDSQGVITITNAPPAERAEAGTPVAPAAPKALTPPPVGESPPGSPGGRRAIVVPPADQPAGSGNQTEAESEAEPPEAESSSAAQNIPQDRIAAPSGAPPDPVPKSPQPPLAVRPVAWQEPPPTPRPPLTDRGAPAPGPIYTYRDSRGVLCIRNMVFEEANEPPPVKQAQQPVIPAAVRKVSTAAAFSPEGQEGLSLPVIPASLSEAKPEPQALPPAVTPQARLAPEIFGGIRRFRDAKGVLNITNVAAEGQEVRPPPVSLASHPALGLSPPVPRLPGGYPVIGPPIPANQEAPRILASRDRKGKLVIRTEEPARSLAAASPPVPPAALEPIIIEASQSYGLPAPLVEAMIKVESNFVPWAVSPKGAMGLMQLMPGTASDLGVKDPFCPRENVLAGCRYFRLLLNSLDNSLPLALAAYNAGLQRVAGAGFRVPSIKETQEFVTQVLERYYQAIKGRPPALGL